MSSETEKALAEQCAIHREEISCLRMLVKQLAAELECISNNRLSTDVPEDERDGHNYAQGWDLLITSAKKAIATGVSPLLDELRAEYSKEPACWNCAVQMTVGCTLKNAEQCGEGLSLWKLYEEDQKAQG